MDWHACKNSTRFTFRVYCPCDWPSGWSSHTVSKFDLALEEEKSLVLKIKDVPLLELTSDETVRAGLRNHLYLLETKIDGSWGIEGRVTTTHKNLRLPIDFLILSGKLDEDSIEHTPQILRWLAELCWLSLQSLPVFTELIHKATGHKPIDLIELYKGWWIEKDGSPAERGISDGLIRGSYTSMARQSMATGIRDVAADASRIANEIHSFYSSAEPNHPKRKNFEEGYQKFLAEFGHLEADWHSIQISIENALSRLGLTASEGPAEWWSFTNCKLVEAGAIKTFSMPIEEATQSITEKFYKRLSSMSDTNPYKRGFNIMRELEQRVGSWLPFMATIITSFPIRYLSNYVLLFWIQKMPPDSPWAPDKRLDLLVSCLNNINKLGEPPKEVLRKIFEELDDNMMGAKRLAVNLIYEMAEGRLR